jgi:hypothetical protein
LTGLSPAQYTSSRVRLHAVFIIVLVSAFLQPCVSSAGGEPAEPTQLGQPRADLTAAELAAFYEGKKLFTQKLPGVGPLYDAETCVDCHNIPTVGGSGDLAHAVIVGPEPGNQQGGDIQYYPMHALAGWKIPTPPLNATRLVAPPLYGLAAIERIPDETIRAACGTGHPHPAKLLGSQPVNVVARFGMKPFVGTLPDFVDSMLQSENSVTSPLDHSKDDDSFPDPEVDRKFVETIAAFIRGLRPPGRNGTDAAGEAAFGTFGCAVCHVPNMPPAEGVFSDFCLHRMGGRTRQWHLRPLRRRRRVPHQAAAGAPLQDSVSARRPRKDSGRGHRGARRRVSGRHERVLQRPGRTARRVAALSQHALTRVSAVAARIRIASINPDRTIFQSIVDSSESIATSLECRPRARPKPHRL